MIYLISYELGETADDFGIVSQIRDYDDYVNVHGRVWLLRTDRTAAEVRQHLKRLAGPTDQLLVCRLHGDVATLNLLVTVDDWLAEGAAEDAG